MVNSGQYCQQRSKTVKSCKKKIQNRQKWSKAVNNGQQRSTSVAWCPKCAASCQNARQGAKNVRLGTNNVRHGANNVQHCAKNVLHGAKNVRHGAKLQTVIHVYEQLG